MQRMNGMPFYYAIDGIVHRRWRSIEWVICATLSLTTIHTCGVVASQSVPIVVINITPGEIDTWHWVFVANTKKK